MSKILTKQEFDLKKLKEDNQKMKNLLLDLVRYIRAGTIETRSDRRFCLDKIGKVLDEVS